MPKRRNTEERIEQYYAKIRKLQHRKVGRRRVIVYSSSDSEENLGKYESTYLLRSEYLVETILNSV